MAKFTKNRRREFRDTYSFFYNLSFNEGGAFLHYKIKKKPPLHNVNHLDIIDVQNSKQTSIT